MLPQPLPPDARPEPWLRISHPELPPLQDLIPLLETVWASGMLTNAGPCHQRLEHALCEHLQVEHLSLFGNASSALMAALSLQGRRGEVITTPLSFVATANAIHWAGLTPVFADVAPGTLNLDPASAQARVTGDTVAVMPVHCFGHPCDTDGFAELARRHDLPVVYDAAHAFGVRRAGRSLLEAGDLAVVSFHATKVFQTFEGGAVVCRSAEAKQCLDRLRNHGLDAKGQVAAPGLNGKMSELHAAVGLLQLQRLPRILEQRAAVDAAYRRGLAAVPGIRCLPLAAQVEPNFAYFPIRVEADYPLARDALGAQLGMQGIQTKPYFWPLICGMEAFRHLPSARPEGLPHAHLAAAQVLCLPIHTRMSGDDVDSVVSLIATFAKK